MTCECKKEIEQKLIDTEWKKRKVLKAELQGYLF